MNELHEKNSAGILFISAYLIFQMVPTIILAFFAKYAESYAYTLASLTLVQTFMLASVFAYSKIRKINVFEGMNLKKFPNILQILLIAAMSIASIYAGNQLSVVFAATLAKMGMKVSTIAPRMNTAAQIIFSVLIIGCLPAVCEETFIRQGVLSGLKRSFPTYKAILLSALMFSLMHTNAAQTIHQFFIGITLATIVVISDSLWSGVLFHFFNNAYVLLMCVIKPNEAKVDFATIDTGAVAWLKAAAYFICGYIVIAALIVIFAALYHRAKHITKGEESVSKYKFFNTRIGNFIHGGINEIRPFFAKNEQIVPSKGNGLTWALVILVAIWTLVFVIGFMS